MDTALMALAFFAAWRLPLGIVIAMIILFEGLTIWQVKDSFFLSGLMLSYPLDFILEWQLGR
jgi:hypothetical protein